MGGRPFGSGGRWTLGLGSGGFGRVGTGPVLPGPLGALGACDEDFFAANGPPGGGAPGAQIPVGAVRSRMPVSALPAPGPSGPNWPAAVPACWRMVSQLKPWRVRRNGPCESLVLKRLSVLWETQASQNR